MRFLKMLTLNATISNKIEKCMSVTIICADVARFSKFVQKRCCVSTLWRKDIGVRGVRALRSFQRTCLMLPSAFKAGKYFSQKNHMIWIQRSNTMLYCQPFEYTLFNCHCGTTITSGSGHIHTYIFCAPF